MITVPKLHNLLYDMALAQGKEVKPGGQTIDCRLILPIDVLNALMDTFNATLKHAAPTWDVDEDNKFYAIYNWVNIRVDICEGFAFRLESIFPNQPIQETPSEHLPVLPDGAQPINTDPELVSPTSPNSNLKPHLS